MIIEQWPIERPRPYENNPRLNAGRPVEKVAASLREYGWQQPIVVDVEGIIIVGHTRWLAAKSLGMAEVPVLVASALSAAQVQAYRLADNRTGEEAEWDREKLFAEITALQTAGCDAALSGFDQQELESLTAFMRKSEDAVGDASAKEGKPRRRGSAVAMWGNTHAIRIPKQILLESGLREGDAVQISTEAPGVLRISKR